MQTISEAAPPVKTPRWLRGRRRFVVALLGVALFFTPAIARIGGVDPTAIENRPLVKLPALSRGFGIFPVLTQWSIDHLPLRDLAIRADAKLSQAVFGQPPTYTEQAGVAGLQAGTLQGARAGNAVTAGLADQVFAGRNGWLFLGQEFTSGCSPQLTLSQVTTGIRRLDQMISASGRTFVMVIPPDKDTVDGRFLPATVPDGPCVKRVKAARWKAIDALHLRSVIDLRPALEAEERATGRPSFLPIDTHWTSRTAATVFLPAMLNALSPRLYRSAKVYSAGPVSYTGDLSVLNGAPETKKDTQWDVTRAHVYPGLTTVTNPFVNFPISHYTNIAPRGIPIVENPTVLYGDSFTERSLGLIAPFFANITRIPEISRAAVQSLRDRAEAIAQLTKLIVSSDVVIVEQTERIIFGSNTGSILDPDVLDAIQKALTNAPRGHPLDVSPGS
jgi:acetyltransferase AlgX (SGNH hydrolase-like protein)